MFAVANVWNCTPMWRKETRRCWDSLARCKRWSDMHETMLRRVRSANMTAYRLGTSQLGLYPTHSTQIHYSVLHRIIFQRTYGFMPALEEYCLRVYFIFGHSDVKRDLKKLPQQMQKENWKLALLHTPKNENYLQNGLIFWPCIVKLYYTKTRERNHKLN